MNKKILENYGKGQQQSKKKEKTESSVGIRVGISILLSVLFSLFFDFLIFSMNFFSSSEILHVSG